MIKIRKRRNLCTLYIHTHCILCRYEYVQIISNLRLEDTTLSPNNIILWHSLLCIPRGIFRSTYIFNGYSSVLTLPRYFGVLENLQFNDNPQHLDILYALWITGSYRIAVYKVLHRDTGVFKVTLTLTQFLFR